MNPFDSYKHNFISLLLSTLFLLWIMIMFQPSIGSSRPFSSSYRCLSICRRDEETLCKRCLFREPMRFGKRASAKATSSLFREPMRFGKKNNNANFRPMMRFGKKDDELFSGAADNFNDSGSNEAIPQPQQRSRPLPNIATWKLGQSNPDNDNTNSNTNNNQGQEPSLVWQLIPQSSSKVAEALSQSLPPVQSPSSSYSSMSNEN